jgi:hypothetical protein
MKLIYPMLLAVVVGSANAATPRQLADAYSAEAAAQSAGFKPSAQRGGAFFAKHFAVSERMPACTSCHTEQPAQPGRHAVTGKEIKPMAVAANSERFTDMAKVEKWFRRNCKEVVGRECTAGEKADFIQFAMENR